MTTDFPNGKNRSLAIYKSFTMRKADIMLPRRRSVYHPGEQSSFKEFLKFRQRIRYLDQLEFRVEFFLRAARKSRRIIQVPFRFTLTDLLLSARMVPLSG